MDGEPTVVWECPWWRVEEWRFQVGGQDYRWYAAQRPVADTVHILGLTLDGRVPVLRQWRVPLQAWVWELPAGLCDVAGEPPEAAARRELEEETGYSADRLELVGRGTVSPGMTNELWNAYLATGLTQTGRGGGIHAERLELSLVPFEGLEDWFCRRAAAGELVDSKIYAHLALARRALR
jgi:ADP-ribose pyrophosphatase